MTAVGSPEGVDVGDLAGMSRPHAGAGAPLRFLRRHPTLRQLARFVLVGALGTALNAVIFLVLRQWWAAVPANLVALLLSTAIGTEVNRLFTFDAARAPHRWRAHAQNLGTVAFYALYSSSVLMLVAAVVDDPPPLLESAAVAAASVLGGAARFAVLRYWVFAGARAAAPPSRR
jgi:putative flippase GtrA